MKKSSSHFHIRCLQGILYCLSHVYKAVSYGLYACKRCCSSPLPVISIGNILAGGTGKTPFVSLLLTTLNDPRIALISTGYKGTNVSKRQVQMVDLHNKEQAKWLGDEPYLIKSLQANTPVYVCKNRMLSLKKAQQEGCHLAILDDGFQFRSVKKNLDIVMMDVHNLFDNGYLLPRGLLREEPSSLKRADYIVLRHGSDKEEFEEALKRLICYTTAKVCGCSWEAKQFKGARELSLKELEGSPVGVFSALGDPSQFMKLLMKCKAHIVQELMLDDHLALSDDNLVAFSSACKALGAKYIVCTLKDYVKLTNIQVSKLPVLFLDAELKITEGKEVFAELCNKIKELVT